MNEAFGNLDELRAALRADADNVAEALLGVPNRKLSTRNTLRWGTKGSLKLELRGGKRGIWQSKESGKGGDLLALIRQQHGCGFADAVAWARNQTGLSAAWPDNDDDRARRAQQDADRRARQAEADARSQAEADADRQRGIERAQSIAAATVSADGMLADHYLRQVRGIPRPPGGWPDAVRWHSGFRALVAVATRADGTVQRVQRVHLAVTGEKASDEEIEQRGLPAVKVTNGPQAGAVVRLPGDPAGPLLVAEGPETGLAVWSATQHETWIALGGIGGVDLPQGRRVVAIADDNPPKHDAKYGHAAKSLAKAVSAWRKIGIDVVVATPWEARRRDRSDMADVILAHGVEAVRKRIQAALNPASATVERVPTAQAQQLVQKAVAAFFTKVDGLSIKRMELEEKAKQAMEGNAPSEAGSDISPSWTDPAKPTELDNVDWADALNTPIVPAKPTTFTHGIRVDVGVGKSHAARQSAAELLAKMRKRGDNRIVVIAVPTLKLGDEQARLFEDLPAAKAAKLTAAIWRGRTAPDPSALDWKGADDVPAIDRGRMCLDLERIRDAQSVGLRPQSSACRRRVNKEWVTCPKFWSCGYQEQRRHQADVWIVAHDMLFTVKPDALGDVAVVVVDEAAWQKGLDGIHGPSMALSLDALSIRDTIYAGSRIPNRMATDRLCNLRSLLHDALRKMPDGPIQRSAMSATVLTEDSASEAYRLEWQREIDPGMHPGMTKAQRKAAMIQAESNRTIPHLAMVWNALRALLAPRGPDASGWLALATTATPDGPVRVLHLKGRKAVRKGWEAPTLLLDALLPIDLVRFYWDDAEMVADVKAQAPYQHVKQVVDRAFAKSMLEPLDQESAAANGEEARRRVNRLHDLRATLIREARRYAPGKVLVVAQKSIKEALLGLGRLPPNVDLAHHNAVAGRDEWRDVAALIVVGRTMPSPGGVKRIAEALTGHAAVNLADWYERADAAREMADGSMIQAEADRHPNPIVEAIRWQACEGELVQIIGRSRGVNRTEVDLVDVLVLTDVPLPMPLVGTLNAADLEPNVLDLMIAAGGMVLENPTDAAAAYPSLWLNREAAKKALQRGKLGTFPYIELLERSQAD